MLYCALGLAIKALAGSMRTKLATSIRVKKRRNRRHKPALAGTSSTSNCDVPQNDFALLFLPFSLIHEDMVRTQQINRTLVTK